MAFFDRVTLEADAIFNYLNTPVVQDYIMLTRSSTVGNSLSKKKIGELMKDKYEDVPGGIGQLELMQDLLMYAMVCTVQKAVSIRYQYGHGSRLYRLCHRRKQDTGQPAQLL